MTRFKIIWNAKLTKLNYFFSPGFVHLTDSSTGNLLTLDKETGSVLWETPMKSPIVALYLAHNNDNMAKVPFTSVSRETLENLLDQFHDPSAGDTAVKQL